MQEKPSDCVVTSPATPPNKRIYAIGDVHGCLDLLKGMMGLIASDLTDYPVSGSGGVADVTIVFLGDYIDRGPQSAQCIQYLMDGPPENLTGCRWICLKGNHEDILHRFLSDTSIGERWVRNGALDTIRSYGATITDADQTDMPALQALLEAYIPESHVRWIARLPALHQEGDYIFVHAGLRPGTRLEDQDPRDLMWIRDEFFHSTNLVPEGMVVHGHIIVPCPELRPHRISIDTGAYKSGILTAIVLEGTSVRFLNTEAIAQKVA